MRRQINAEKRLSREKTHELVELAKAGDQRAFNKLFAKYKPILFTIAKKRMFNAEYEDIEDEIIHFLGDLFSLRLDQFDSSIAIFDTWVTRCFHNHLNSIPGRKKRVSATSLNEIYIRTQDEVVEYSIPDESTAQTANILNSTPSFRRLARVLLTHLTKLEASVIVMKFWYGYSDKEIEAHHQIPTGTAWYRQKRAIVKLRKKVRIEEYL